MTLGVFEHLAKAGLKLKPSKCEFFRDSLHYLGHIVSKKGIVTDPKKIETILNCPRPKMVTDVRSFTDFTNYYHKYIKDYVKIARPLYELTSGENSKKKRHNIDWTNRCQQSFECLKEPCSQCPVLAYANYKCRSCQVRAQGKVKEARLLLTCNPLFIYNGAGTQLLTACTSRIFPE